APVGVADAAGCVACHTREHGKLADGKPSADVTRAYGAGGLVCRADRPSQQSGGVADPAGGQLCCTQRAATRRPHATRGGAGAATATEAARARNDRAGAVDPAHLPATGCGSAKPHGVKPHARLVLARAGLCRYLVPGCEEQTPHISTVRPPTPV